MKAGLCHVRCVAALFVLALAPALAQVAPPGGTGPQAGMNLVGVWQTSVQLGQGMPPATGLFRAQPDGSYREEMYVGGLLAAYWEGRFTLAPDGTLTQNETGKSPQICLPTGCVPNEGPTTSVSRVSFGGPNAFTVNTQDPATGQTFSLYWQRAEGAAPTPTPQPVPTPPLSQPIPPQPNQASPVVGTWQLVTQGQSGPMTHLSTYAPDGRYTYVAYFNGRASSTAAGTWAFQNGVLSETTTQRSPQICILYCEPNTGGLGTATSRVTFGDANTLLMGLPDGSSVTWRRAQPGSAPTPSAMPDPGTLPGGATIPGWTPTVPGAAGGYDPTGGFIDGVIWEESPYVNPSDGSTFNLPNSPDPDTTYTSPSGNDLRYDEGLDTWYEVDPYGFETEIEPSE